MGKILCTLSDEWGNLPIHMTPQYGNYIPIQREKTSTDAKSINDLNTKVVVTEQKTIDDKTGDISSIFRQIKAQKSGD